MIILAWKAYFWFMVCLMGGSLGLDIAGWFAGGDFDPTDIFFLALSLTSLAGLFGYAYQTALLTIPFWRVILLLQVAVLAYSILVLTGVIPVSPEPISLDIPLIGIIVFVMVPELLALFLYSFKSEGLWV